MTGSVYAIIQARSMYRGTTMAGIIMDESHHDPKRGFSGGYEMETLSLGLPSSSPSSIRAPGAAAYDRIDAIPTWPACGWSARTCRRRPTASHSIPRPRMPTECQWPVCTTTTIPTTSPCATTPTGRGGRLRGGRRDATFPTPPYPSTHNLGTNRMSEKPRDGVVNKYGQTHESRTCSSPTAASSRPAPQNPTLTIVTLAIRQADLSPGR